MKKDWNPELYLKFDKERTQPSIDLVSRINCENPSKIIDIGCGPGNSTQILAQRWPNAEITGIDNSPAMIDKAKSDYPKQNWLLLDAGKDEIPGKFELVFSNAAIQWIPDHAKLLEKLHTLLNHEGILAIQVPLFWNMPIGKTIVETSNKSKWKEQTKGIKELFTIHEPSFYYNQLAKLFTTIELWETDYIHKMNSHHAILEMIRSTGLKPFLERLDSDNDKNDFENSVLLEIMKNYPLQDNGKVLFPFKRLFFIAQKA
jgi:trans-aconitate 2-methyltransferase